MRTHGSRCWSIASPSFSSAAFAACYRDADDEETATSDPDAAGRSPCCRKPAPFASVRSTAGCRIAPIRMRASAPSQPPDRIRHPALLRNRQPPRCETCWIPLATPARSAHLNDPVVSPRACGRCLPSLRPSSPQPIKRSSSIRSALRSPVCRPHAPHPA